MSSCQCTVTPSSPGWKIVVYPASANLQTENSEFSDRCGRMSRPYAASLSFLLGSNTFLFVCANGPFVMLTCLSDGLPVGMCASCIQQKLEVVAESRTVVDF